ncbi:uncharacterized protein LOC130901890 [Diorhabda carinulata]|uniref:uncharacterized protein LOC130901890 n=1 Tax=Diorhabda carinulata TaxID=1163345 RepID=UPI0025A01B92|nr:uncharacterized protein LOC130901890 [Diorhabda carinulata]
MESVILRYAPSYWNKKYTNISNVIPINSGPEYQKIASDVYQATHFRAFESIFRIQNIYELGQMLVREQLMITLADSNKFYRVRRFTKVKKHFLQIALAFNLDHRRCGLPILEFKKHLRGIRPDDVILAVIVVTSTPEADVIIPESSLEYFIDYIINVSWKKY